MNSNKEYIIHKNLKDAIQIFTDLRLFGQYHLLIKSVELINDKENLNTYQISEQPFSFIPIKIKYLVQVSAHENTLKYKVSGVPLLSPKIEYAFTTQNEDTVVLKYSLNISGMPLAKNILKYKMVKAQNMLINVINRA